MHNHSEAREERIEILQLEIIADALLAIVSTEKSILARLDQLVASNPPHPSDKLQLILGDAQSQ